MEHLSLLVLLIASLVISGDGYDIPTVTQVLILNKTPAESIELPCIVEGADFDSYEHTVEWRKMQKKSDTTGVLVATFKNLVDVFKATNRYTVDTDIETNTKNFTLKITDMQDVDSGWYRCQVQEGGAVTKSVKHRVSIIDPVESLTIRGFLSTANMTSEEQWRMPEIDDMPVDTSPAQLDFRENVLGSVGCMSYGGYPIPVTLRLLIGTKQISGQMQHDSMVYLEGDTPGLQKIRNFAQTFTNKFRASADQDGKTLICRSQIGAGENILDKKEVSTILKVQGAPLFHNCSEPVQFPLGSTGAQLKCAFFAKPEHTRITWYGITTQVTVSGSSVPGNTERLKAFTQALSGDYMYEAVLQFPKLVASDFQSYKLTVVNEVGRKETTIQLRQGTSLGSGETRDGVERFCASVIITTLSLSLAALLMQ